MSSSVRAIPVRISGYRAFARIGRGGAADVYAAIDALGTVRALKVAHAVSSRGQEALEREFQIQAWVDDASLVGALDIGVLPDGRGWLALEHVDGVLARYWVGVHDTSSGERARRTVRVVAQVARALAALAARGLVHGDVKPSNLLVEPDGTVRLLDLGMARWVGGDWVPEGRFAGTPTYASPEQLAGAALTPAADVFSLAATAYALVGGRSPFPSSTERPAGLVPEPLRGINPLLAELLVEALDPDPANRPEAQIIADLAASMVLAPDPEPSEAPAPLRPAHEQLVALLGIAGEPLDTATVALAVGEEPAVVRTLLEDLEARELVAYRGGAWSSDAPVVERAPWNDALAEALLGALDPEPSLARAHALLHLGETAAASAEVLRLGGASARLSQLDEAVEALWRRQRAAFDASLEASEIDLALRPEGDSALARGFRAALRGDGEAVALCVAEAGAEGADKGVAAILRARGLALRGRDSAAVGVLEDVLAGTPERVCRSVARIELAWLQQRIGRVRLAAELLDTVRRELPANPSPALLARWVRVQSQLAVDRRERLDADLLLRARSGLGRGGDARVLAALEVLARSGGDEALTDAITACTEPGDDQPDLAAAVALSIRVTGVLPDLPDALAEWLAVPGRERWQFEVLTAALDTVPAPALVDQLRDVTARMLSKWSREDAYVFRLHPRWRRWL